jgi:hypothetical protein
MLRYFIFSVIAFITFLTLPQFAYSEGKSFKVEGVYEEGSKQAQQLMENEDRYADSENAQRQSANSSASTSSSSNSSNSKSGWKFIKQYEGGFAEFGLDTYRTVFIIECGNGRQYKMYMRKNGKWGGLDGGNGGNSFEEAASNTCE